MASNDVTRASVDELFLRLEELDSRRKANLREMYHIIRRREDIGPVFHMDSGEEDNLEVFLERFDLRKHPETGSISNLSDFEVSIPTPMNSDEMYTLPADIPSPSTGEQTAEAPEVELATLEESDLPISQPPAFPAALSEEEVDPNQAEMNVDALADLPPSPAAQSMACVEKPQSTTSLVLPDTLAYPDEDNDDRDPLELIGGYSSPSSASESSVENHTRPTSRSASRQPRTESSETPEHDLPLGESQAQMNEDQKPEIGEDIVMTDESLTVDPTLLSKLQPPVRNLPLPGTTIGRIISPPLLISITKSAFRPIPDYTFQDGAELPYVTPSIRPVSPTVFQHQFNPRYTLPPLSSLPPEFNRKGKPTKQQRKREKEREKTEKGSEKGEGRRDRDRDRDDWMPMGLNKWAATLRANPVWKRVSRAGKCLNTREWSVAMAELKLVRTLDRIEMLKDQGRWSFRQPKKQRGVGGLMKTHWDHLLDEMKWMRLDFREERKWKLALAFDLSLAVLEWHEAGSLEERVGRGICVLWRPPRGEHRIFPVEDDYPPVKQVELGQASVPEGEHEHEEEVIDTTDAFGLEEAHKNISMDVVDALQPAAVVEDTLGRLRHSVVTAEEHADEGPPRSNVPMKLEDIDDTSALQIGTTITVGSDMEVDPQMLTDNGTGDNGRPNSKQEWVEGADGLKPGSENTVLSDEPQALSTPHEGESSTQAGGIAGKPSSKLNVYAPLRDSITCLPEISLFVDMDELDLVTALSDLTTVDPAFEAPPAPTDLSSIFPELQPLVSFLGPSHTVSPSTPLVDGRKKADKKTDRDDPLKRMEETTFTKLTPMGQFMYSKPTLLSALKPAKRWNKGKWVDLEESIATADIDNSTVRSSDENVCVSALFEGTKSVITSTSSFLLPLPKDPRKRAAETSWTVNEDLILKGLAEKFQHNWPLVADSFNSSRVSISTDKRTAWDCMERWNVRWGTGNKLQPSIVAGDSSGITSADGMSPPPPSAGQGQMTTRGLKRLASASISSVTGSPLASGADSRKRRRHGLMYDAIRKLAKKREAAQKTSVNQKKVAQVHDTHGQYNKMPKLTPAELSRMKAEKESQENQQMLLAKRRNEELVRQQQAMREHSLRIQGGQNAPMLQTSGGPARNGLVASQGMPQIRGQVNISQQQQRLPNSVGVVGNRLTHQQVLQAQAQARALAAAQAQAVVSGVLPNASSGMNNAHMSPHLSPAFASRAATSSPAGHQSSPPRSSGTPANSSNPPRPSSAQQHPGIPGGSALSALSGVPGNPIARQAQIGHFFPNVPNVHNGQFAQEQMEHALRMQNLIQAQHRHAGGSTPQNGPYPSQS